MCRNGREAAQRSVLDLSNQFQEKESVIRYACMYVFVRVCMYVDAPSRMNVRMYGACESTHMAMRLSKKYIEIVARSCIRVRLYIYIYIYI
jgi:hypothetical protein